MNKEQAQIWQKWSVKIRSQQMENLVVGLLELGKPLNNIAAQLVHISQPVMSAFVDRSKLSAFAELLEEDENTQFFINSLSKENNQ